MTKFTAAEFAAHCQQLVGADAGWQARAAKTLKIADNTMAKFLDKGPSGGVSQALRSALGIASGFEPTAAETRQHTRRQDYLRARGVYSSI